MFGVSAVCRLSHTVWRVVFVDVGRFSVFFLFGCFLVLFLFVDCAVVFSESVKRSISMERSHYNLQADSSSIRSQLVAYLQAAQRMLTVYMHAWFSISHHHQRRPSGLL